jgi:hypothetical protein
MDMPSRDLKVKQMKMVFTQPPSILNNIKSKPLIGKQYLALSNFVAEFDPDEKHYDCSSNLFHACNKYP